MSAEHVEARPGAYADSVTLMRISADVRQADGVQAALIAMATELNLGLLPGMGFRPPDGAGPNDLLIAVRAAGQAQLDAALAAVDAALTARPPLDYGAATTGLPTTEPRTTGPRSTGPRCTGPRTTGTAARASGPGPGADLGAGPVCVRRGDGRAGRWL